MTLSGDTVRVSSKISSGSNAVVAMKVRYSAQRRAYSPADYLAALRAQLRRRPLHAFLYVGLADADRGLSTSFAPQLRAAGATVRYAEYPGRHSWRLWRDTTPAALAFADRWFGG